MVMPALGGDARRRYKRQQYSISVEGPRSSHGRLMGGHLLFTTRRIAASPERSYGLHRLTLGDRRSRGLGLDDEPMYYDTSPAVSPDGQWLAFTRYMRGSGSIGSCCSGSDRVRCRGRAATGAGSRAGHPSLAALGPGQRPALVQQRRSDIRVAARRLAPIHPHARPALLDADDVDRAARDGRAAAAVVVRRGDEDLFALPVDPVTHSATRRCRGSRANPPGVDYHPRISPDGRTLAFVSDRSGARDIWLANPDGTNPRQLTTRRPTHRRLSALVARQQDDRFSLLGSG